MLAGVGVVFARREHTQRGFTMNHAKIAFYRIAPIVALVVTVAAPRKWK